MKSISSKIILKACQLGHEFKILKLEFGKNSVRLIINCQTTDSIPNLIKALKGGSARFLYKEFPDSKVEHGSSLWDPKYIISTDEIQFDKMIQNYKGVSTTI
ncbi:transposase [Neobacillus cucumis]|nr:transposase [Neobacillus cucumis]